MVIGDVLDQVPFQSRLIVFPAVSIEGFLITISLELYSDLKARRRFEIIPIIASFYFSEGKRGARFIPSPCS